MTSADPQKTPPTPPRPPSRFTRLLFPRAIITLLSLGAVYLVLQMLWGESTAKSWQLYLGALGFGCLGLLGWWLLVSTDLEKARATGSYGKAWLGLPFCMLGVIGMMPLLVITVSTEARLRMDPYDRIDARIVKDELVIAFQKPTSANTVNLTINEAPITLEQLNTVPQTYIWGDGNRVLRVRLIHLGLDPGGVRSIRINAIIDESVAHLRDGQGVRIPQQRVVVTK